MSEQRGGVRERLTLSAVDRLCLYCRLLGMLSLRCKLDQMLGLRCEEIGGNQFTWGCPWVSSLASFTSMMKTVNACSFFWLSSWFAKFQLLSIPAQIHWQKVQLQDKYFSDLATVWQQTCVNHAKRPMSQFISRQLVLP